MRKRRTRVGQMGQGCMLGRGHFARCERAERGCGCLCHRQRGEAKVSRATGQSLRQRQRVRNKLTTPATPVTLPTKEG